MMEDGHVSTNSATGTDCPTSSYTKTNTSSIMTVRAGQSGASVPCIRSYVQWDVSYIPDGSTITDVQLRVQVSSITSSARNCDINQLSDDARAAQAVDVWTDIEDGNTYVANDSFCTTTGVKTLDLGSSANTDLQAALSSNIFGIGIKFNDEVRDATNHQMAFATLEHTTQLEPILDVTFTPPNGDTQVFGIVYSDHTGTQDNQPRYRQYHPDTMNWTTPEVQLPATGASDVIHSTWMGYYPGNSSNIVVVTQSNDGTLNLFRCLGDCETAANWSLLHADFADIGSASTSAVFRAFAAAFEQDSGELVIVYDSGVSEANDLYYRIFYTNNGTLTSATGIDYYGSGSDSELIAAMEMASSTDESSDELLLGWNDLTNEDSFAYVWDGSSFGNLKTLGTSVVNLGDFEYAIAVTYEQSGSAIAASNNGTDTVTWARWNGITWGSLHSEDPDGGVSSNQVTITLTPSNAASSTEVLYCTGMGSDIYCAELTGGSASAWTNLGDTGNPGGNAYRFGMAYNPSANTGYLVYRASAFNLGWRTYDGNTNTFGREYLRYHNTYSMGNVFAVSSNNATDTINVMVIAQGTATTPGYYLGTGCFDSTGFCLSVPAKIDDSAISQDLEIWGFYLAAQPSQAADTVTVQITLNMAGGSDTPQTAGVAYDVNCFGGGGSHDGNPATQTFTCDASTTVTVTVPTDAATSRFRFDDGATVQTFESCSNGTCDPEVYDDNTRQFKLTITAEGVDSDVNAQIATTLHTNFAVQDVPGSTAAPVWADQETSAIMGSTVIVVVDRERFQSYNSTSERTFNVASALSKTYVFQHEFNTRFRVAEGNEGVGLSLMPPGVFTVQVVTANGTAHDLTFSIQNSDNHLDTASRVWIVNGTNTFGDMTWRSLVVRPSGQTCAVLVAADADICDITTFSKHVGLSSAGHFRLAADQMTALVDNVSHDSANARLTFNATSSGNQTVKVEFKSTDYGGVERVRVNGVDYPSANWEVVAIDLTLRVLEISDVPFSEDEFIIDFSLGVPPTLGFTFWQAPWAASHLHNDTTHILTTFVRHADTPYDYTIEVTNSTGDFVVNTEFTSSDELDIQTFNLTNGGAPFKLEIFNEDGAKIYTAYLESIGGWMSPIADAFAPYSFAGWNILLFLPLTFAALFTRNTASIGGALTVAFISVIVWFGILDLSAGVMWFITVVAIIGMFAYRRLFD